MTSIRPNVSGRERSIYKRGLPVLQANEGAQISSPLSTKLSLRVLPNVAVQFGTSLAICQYHKQAVLDRKITSRPIRPCARNRTNLLLNYLSQNRLRYPQSWRCFTRSF